MAISNCMFSPTSENPCGFLAWSALAKFHDKPRNCSYPKPLCYIQKNKLNLDKK